MRVLYSVQDDVATTPILMCTDAFGMLVLAHTFQQEYTFVDLNDVYVKHKVSYPFVNTTIL